MPEQQPSAPVSHSLPRVLYELLTKGVPFILVFGVGYAAEKGADGGFIQDIWTAAKQASPFAAMCAVWAWLDERRERREAQRQCADRTVDFINTTNESTKTIERAIKILTEAAVRPRARRRR